MKYEEIDDFIGQKFGEQGQVEVIGKKRENGYTLYQVKCSVCSPDTELFKDGVFNITKGNLTDGKLPCGCAKSMRWSKDQFTLRVTRKCAENNCQFLGFSGDWKKSQTKLKLLCNECDNRWESTDINSLLNRKSRCPECSSYTLHANRRKLDSVAIEKFFASGAFLSGTEFKRSEEDREIWGYSCPVCSNDQYVSAGLCSGVFQAVSYSLSKGALACRCSRNFLWSQAQREYQINQKLEKDGLGIKFLGWEDSYQNMRSKMILECPQHGQWKIRFGNFVSERGCPACAKTGYKKLLDGYLYVFRAQKEACKFAGYGISNTPVVRLATHRYNLSKYGFSIAELEIFKTSGQIALDIENHIKYSFPCNPQEIEGFKREATHSHLYENVVDFVKAKLKLFEEYQDNQNILCYSEDIDTAIVQRRNCLEELYHERETNTYPTQH